ncbi:MAG: AMP-binding protein, partial [Dehalococcoidia bacterium]|nr:AMP-binding protein [Dehalococcoidia bacterium]
MVMIPDILDRNARRSPDKTAVVCEGRRYTFSQLRERSNRLANGLLALDARKGDRVAVLAQNCSEYVEVYCAAALAGLITTPINWRFVEKELVKVINFVEPCILIVEAEFASTVEAIRPQIPFVRSILIIGGERPGMRQYEALIAGSPAQASSVQVAPEDLACLIHTSGTTGTPKE